MPRRWLKPGSLSIINNPDDIVQWDTSDEWYTTMASNDLRIGGKLVLRIESHDGKTGFDFAATYTKLETNSLIEFVADDGCTVKCDAGR